ncbi:MAG: tol-pal system protein YbgF [Rudaea sp.]|nr:tol-pal system protein YbgF [Rudaea sp.]
MRCSRLLSGMSMAAALMAAVAFSLPAQAQRLSLAERVAKLEQQSQGQNGAQANIELVNQINALQSQVQTLQGQVEELRHQLDELKSRSKDQYIDLDSRIGRLEGRNSGAPAAAAPQAGANNGQLQDIPLGGAAGAAPPQGTAPQDASNIPPGEISAPPQAANPADEKSAYDQAFNALKDGRYAESARRFQAFIDQYPGSELTPNAYYWLGESYYVTQNYPISLNTFQKLLAQYPNGQKAPDALLKIGYCQYEMKQWDQAEATLNLVLQRYPNTTVANLAQGRLRALKLEGRR